MPDCAWALSQQSLELLFVPTVHIVPTLAQYTYLSHTTPCDEVHHFGWLGRIGLMPPCSGECEHHRARSLEEVAQCTATIHFALPNHHHLLPVIFSRSSPASHSADIPNVACNSHAQSLRDVAIKQTLTHDIRSLELTPLWLKPNDALERYDPHSLERSEVAWWPGRRTCTPVSCSPGFT